ncbi:PD-(D/E)XK nuclease family protein [Streptomyces javensis]
MYGALKVRPDLKTTDWSRRYDNSQPFVLGIIREIAIKLHGDPRTETWEELDTALQIELSQYNLHPGILSYARPAIENYLDCHEAVEAEIGRLRLRTYDPTVIAGASTNRLTVWAPIYDSHSGVREVRRLRFGKARQPGEEPDQWTVVAAYVASLVRPIGDLERIRVIEFGLEDGSAEVLFDATPQEAASNYNSLTLPKLHKIVDARNATPGYSCKECKIAGCCGSLQRLDGFLGQPTPGPATRSVSARDIEVYEVCAAKWLLEMSSLPTQKNSGPSSQRGINIHRWLAMAHMRSTRCTPESVDSLEESLGAPLTNDEHSEARDYLLGHTKTCPLGDGVQIIASEYPVYGYDAQADVIIASKPDMAYIDSDGTFVIRETKTTTREIPESEKDAFDKYLAVPWLLNLFASGYRGPHQSDKARLELEVLSPEGSRVFSWDADNARLLRMAKAEVRLRARAWHKDTTWSATPGAHCSWCTVKKWCPDARSADAEVGVESELSI